MTREDQKAEALRRMEMLDIIGTARQEFRHEDKLNTSETAGILFWTSDEDLVQIHEWEEKTGNLVYHVIKTNTEFGLLLNLLFVSQYEEEWENEREDMKEGYIFSYVINLDEPMFSEYGDIAIVSVNGGVVRVG